MYRWVAGWKVGKRTNGWVDEGIDGWMGNRMDGRVG